MSKIRILSEGLRNKIAAGEVVERPASVVKELLENSIDAGSTKIEITILKAGKRLVKVSDNGAGMDREDALLAFQRYATSKIKDEEDLFNVRTMGFRGEALSSIASVSKVLLTTGVRHTTGTCIEIVGGDVKEVKECPSIGTTIFVRDLFFNTPARRKFLKSDSTENYHVIDIVTREAQSHYKTAFVLSIDGSEVLHLPAASTRRERLLQVYGKEFVDGLIETGIEENQTSVTMYLGKPTNVRNNKNNQFLYVNARAVKDPSMSHAVYKAYEGFIPLEKHPVFFVFLTVNPQRVDCNVHPTKREVRFEDKTAVFNFVYRAARNALAGTLKRHYPDQSRDAAEGSYTSFTVGAPSLGEVSSHYSTSQEPTEVTGQLFNECIPYLYLGETFIAIPHRGGLALVDYHAAHERINYERFLRRIEIPSHRLLFPQQARVSAGDYRVLLENTRLLNDFGIEVADFGHETIMVKGVPELLKDADMTALMSDIAGVLLQRDSVDTRFGDSGVAADPIELKRRSLAARLACHSSIRGKEVPGGAQIAELMRNLEALENSDFCPHGRPTTIFLSMAALRKMFKK